MEADLKARVFEPVLAPPPRRARYLALWLGLAMLGGGALYAVELRQARTAFDARSDGVQHLVAAELGEADVVLDAIAAFVGSVGAADQSALQAYCASLLQHRPRIRQVALLRLPPIGGGQRSGVDVAARCPPRTAAGQAPAGANRETAARALGGSGAMASRLFRSTDGGWVYALRRGVPSGGGGYLLSVLVRVEDLLPPVAGLPAGIAIGLRHADQAELPWMVQGERLPVWQRRLLPRLRTTRAIAVGDQPLVLTVERQLGWSAFDPLLAAAALLAAGLALLAALRYGDRRTRREAARQRSEHKLYRLANFDGLTALPNRNLFSDRLRQALSRARRHGSCIALFFLDLDGFKAVNDSAGHAAGDRLLQLVSARLLKAVREQDTVARMSGDEFVVLLEDIQSREDAERVLRQLHAAFVESFGIDSFEFMVSASIGLALYPDDGEAPEQLLHRADQRMYAVKHPEWAPGA